MLKEVIDALNEIYKKLGDIPVLVNLGEDCISIDTVELACVREEEYAIIFNPHEVEK